MILPIEIPNPKTVKAQSITLLWSFTELALFPNWSFLICRVVWHIYAKKDIDGRYAFTRTKAVDILRHWGILHRWPYHEGFQCNCIISVLILYLLIGIDRVSCHTLLKYFPISLWIYGSVVSDFSKMIMWSKTCSVIICSGWYPVCPSTSSECCLLGVL